MPASMPYCQTFDEFLDEHCKVSASTWLGSDYFKELSDRCRPISHNETFLEDESIFNYLTLIDALSGKFPGPIDIASSKNQRLTPGAQRLDQRIDPIAFYHYHNPKPKSTDGSTHQFTATKATHIEKGLDTSRMKVPVGSYLESDDLLRAFELSDKHILVSRQEAQKVFRDFVWRNEEYQRSVRVKEDRRNLPKRAIHTYITVASCYSVPMPIFRTQDYTDSFLSFIKSGRTNPNHPQSQAQESEDVFRSRIFREARAENARQEAQRAEIEKQLKRRKEELDRLRRMRTANWVDERNTHEVARLEGERAPKKRSAPADDADAQIPPPSKKNKKTKQTPAEFTIHEDAPTPEKRKRGRPKKHQPIEQQQEEVAEVSPMPAKKSAHKKKRSLSQQAMVNNALLAQKEDCES